MLSNLTSLTRLLLASLKCTEITPANTFKTVNTTYENPSTFKFAYTSHHSIWSCFVNFLCLFYGIFIDFRVGFVSFFVPGFGKDLVDGEH